MDQDLLERIIASPRLPSMPAVALEIIALVQDPDVAVDRLAATIANDPALAAKILKTVNSSFYAQARTIASIDQAIVVMGLNSVRILALGFSLTDNLRKDAHDTANFDHNYFWQRSILSATTSRSVAARFSAGQGDEAFLAGLLDQLGVLTMHETIGDAYDRAGAGAWGDGAMLIAHEEEAFDLNHAVVGHALADSWSLPQRLTTCLRWYTNPDGADPEDLALVRVVAIADFVATVFLGPNPGDALQSLQRAAAQWYDLSPASVEDLITYVRNETDEMGNLFDLPADDIPAAAEILTRANAALTEITLQAAQQTTLLEHRNRELASLAATDSLTGVANRRGFDDFLAQQARISARYRGPLSLLLADLDHFKQVNESAGSPRRRRGPAPRRRGPPRNRPARRTSSPATAARSSASSSPTPPFPVPSPSPTASAPPSKSSASPSPAAPPSLSPSASASPPATSTSSAVPRASSPTPTPASTPPSRPAATASWSAAPTPPNAPRFVLSRDGHRPAPVEACPEPSGRGPAPRSAASSPPWGRGLR